MIGKKQLMQIKTKQNKKISDSSIFLANTKGQPLKEHLLAVAFYGYLLLKSLKFKPDIEKEINKYLICSALLHDIGKVSNSFQEYIKKHINKEQGLESIPTDAESLRKKSFKGPFHNEISWAYTANFIKIDMIIALENICHSIYWHHPANWNEKNNQLNFKNSKIIFEEVTNQLKEDTEILLKQMYRFVSDLFLSFYSIYGKSIEYLKYDLTVPKKDQINEMLCPPVFFSHKLKEISNNAKKQLCLNLLLESDRAVSEWDVEKTHSFLKQISESKKLISSWNFNESKRFFEEWSKTSCGFKKLEHFPVLEKFANKRSKEQYKLANKMSDKPLSVCGVDPAGGKTSIALYWWGRSDNKYPLMIALPRQHQVTGLFNSLKKDSRRIYKDTDIKIEGVFNGQRQNHNWNPHEGSDLLISDINIMVFDRFLSPYYKRSQSSEFIKMLSSHLVLDEFHEFKNISKMIPSLKEILHIRDWLDSGVKTLMLSGTPEPALLKLLNVEKGNVFKRKNLSPRENHKFKLSIKEKPPLNMFIPDCLYSFLRVESCQEVFAFLYKKYQDKVTIIHSYFTSDHKNKRLKGILQEHGSTEVFSSGKSVVTAKMLQSSYNLSFGQAVLELSQPDTDCQTAGRINRFENKSQAEMQFFYDEETEKFFNENQAGFKTVHQAWKRHLLFFIAENKKKAVSIRQLMECYDRFWNDENNISKASLILSKQQEEAIEELNKYIPKRFIAKKGKTASSYLNSLFRGESRLLSACVVDDTGTPTTPYQLYGESLMGEGRGWLIKKIIKAMESCLKPSKCASANKIKSAGKDVFEYNKHVMKYAGKSIGYKAERPLLLSHSNKDIDNCLNNQLSDEDSKTEHRVYNKQFGLIKKSLLTNGQ